jgi:integrase/recombinase XerD
MPNNSQSNSQRTGVAKLTCCQPLAISPAVLGMRVSDFYKNGRRRWFRLLEKGGKHHEVPVHHKAQDYVAEYLEKAGFQPNGPLFQLSRRDNLPAGLSRSEAYRMIRRRAIDAGVFAPVCCHSFRATGIIVYLENKGTLEVAQKIAVHESPRTTKLYGRTDDQLTLDEIEKDFGLKNRHCNRRHRDTNLELR